MHSLSELLGPDGPFADRLPGFAPRRQQQEMATAVGEALEAGQTLVCEAGTGTGKTFAYLVPALQSGQKIVISTGTRNLQDQLFHRDLPTVGSALARGTRAALLKGRANYLCLQRLEMAQGERSLFPGPTLADVSRIQEWVGRTDSGDIAEITNIPERAPVWPLVTSTTDNCLGQECPQLEDCFVLKARREAMQADVVVVNHHLLFADLALKDEGFGELLPGADGVIVDEAHQVPEIAAQYFGKSVGSRQIQDLARDTVANYYEEAGDVPELLDLTQALEGAVSEALNSIGGEPRRAAFTELTARAEVPKALQTLSECLDGLAGALVELSERGRGLASCHERSLMLLGRLRTAMSSEQDGMIRWYEMRPRSFTLHATPLDVAQTFNEYRSGQSGTWIFTSATLAVGESFKHFTSRLGIDGHREQRWDSPFDFMQQAMCYLPEGLPEPGNRDYTHELVDISVPVLEASRGHAFMLFTSHRALREAARLLPERLDYPLLVQGEAPKAELLERFRKTPNAVLLGTASFWEGVDVRGEALSLVIIDKLPFASPGDPLQAARQAAIKAEGGEPFRQLQLPQAVIALKQGAGRLIRDPADRGVLMLCDPRLLNRSYGRVFLRSLPPMPLTQSLPDVVNFFLPQAREATA